MLFFPILILGIVLTAILWRAADRRARRLPAGLAVTVRLAFALFYVIVLSYTLIPLARPFIDEEPIFPPDVWATIAYLWFPFVLQMTFAAIVAGWLVRKGYRRLRAAPAGEPGGSAAGLPASDPPTSDATFSRRDALALAALAVPPIATVGLTIIARRQAGQFAVRRLDLPIASLPPDLDGLTIAHVTDTHAGNFFDGDAAARLADAVNAMRVDLVAFTGDLIDRGQMPRLPDGLRLIDNLDRRHGFAMVEGNHDVQRRSLMFEEALAARQLPLLLDDQLVCNVPGRSTPVQLLGVSWGELKVAEDEEIDPEDPPQPGREWTPEWAATSVKAVAAMRQPGAFPILLAHHPHTIESAAAAGLPLVLSGHTHGGQLMLTDRIGGGPLRFKYWTGTHMVGNSRLVICNGVGSWFPLRVNAPAEVLHLTLRSKAQEEPRTQ